MSKIEKMPDVEVQSGSWLLLPTQETLEKRVAGGGNSKKRKRASALGNVLGRETAWWTCVGGTLEARPLVLDDSDGDRCWFPSCFLLLYPASRQCCFRTRADSSCDWLPVPLPDPTTGLGPMVKKSTKAEACCVSLP